MGIITNKQECLNKIKEDNYSLKLISKELQNE